MDRIATNNISTYQTMNHPITRTDETKKSAKLHVLRREAEVTLQRKSPDRIAIPTSDGIALIPLRDITYIQAESNYSNVHTTTSRRYLISKSLKHCQARLAAQGFIRTHQSYLVNDTHVVGLKNAHSSTIVLSDGSALPVSRRHQAKIKNYLITHFSI